jgi:hypothetical protein
MNERTRTGRVLQMRLVVEASEYETAVVFYRDVLGAPEEQGLGIVRACLVGNGRLSEPGSMYEQARLPA